MEDIRLVQHPYHPPRLIGGKYLFQPPNHFLMPRSSQRHRRPGKEQILQTLEIQRLAVAKSNQPERLWREKIRQRLAIASHQALMRSDPRLLAEFVGQPLIRISEPVISRFANVPN